LYEKLYCQAVVLMKDEDGAKLKEYSTAAQERGNHKRGATYLSHRVIERSCPFISWLQRTFMNSLPADPSIEHSPGARLTSRTRNSLRKSTCVELSGCAPPPVP